MSKHETSEEKGLARRSDCFARKRVTHVEDHAIAADIYDALIENGNHFESLTALSKELPNDSSRIARIVRECELFDAVESHRETAVVLSNTGLRIDNAREYLGITISGVGGDH